RIVCWGDLASLLGDGKHAHREVHSGYWSAKSIAVGDAFGCFIRVDGALLCFGSDQAMGLRAPKRGLGDPRLVTTGTRPFCTLGAGARHACAIATGIVCWGKNDESQLGDATVADSLEPVNVTLE